MGKSFYTGTDLEMYDGANTLAATLAVSFAAYGFLESAAETYSDAAAAYATAYRTATTVATRTKITVAEKSTQKDSLRALTSRYASIIDGTPTVTDAMRIAVGLNVRKTPTPRPTPAAKPIVEIVSASGRTINGRLRAASGDGRSREDGSVGASLWTYVGATAPLDPGAWTFWGNVNRLNFEVTFGDDVPNGASVFLTAFWIGSRMESGTAATPVQAFLPGGSATPVVNKTAKPMKLAA